VRPWRTQLSRLQDILGAMSDAAAARQRVQAMLGSAQAPTAAEARGILLGWNEGRARTLERELRREWKVFRKSERFW
jgi:CHAD domain-containing protein